MNIKKEMLKKRNSIVIKQNKSLKGHFRADGSRATNVRRGGQVNERDSRRSLTANSKRQEIRPLGRTPLINENKLIMVKYKKEKKDRVRVEALEHSTTYSSKRGPPRSTPYDVADSLWLIYVDKFLLWILS